MNILILLTLLCLGMASAAPKVDHSAEAQSDLWMVDTVEDTVNNAALEKSPEVLEKDNQEQGEQQESLQTAMNASDYITLQMKISRRLFDMIKGVTRKSVLKKGVKGFGKKVVGEIIKPENLGGIVYGIGKEILGGKKTQESSTTPNVVTEGTFAFWKPHRQALHHYWGHYTMEDAQHLEPKTDADELLQIIDAMDICAQDLSSGAVVNILTLIKTHDLYHICMLKKDEVKAFVYGVMCIIPMEHLTHFPCSSFTRSW
ncbi:hypothetical protein HJG60_009771 [Phyllostomus discolor]|uniref:Uncharacterized protein n=1 Tax=Phyllostomus discolor TaxID=89673 RepID=A0A834BC65_9CHIR|nr:hypothetical protein HJG60_009771 [Phyllostomus discolor]